MERERSRNRQKRKKNITTEVIKMEEKKKQVEDISELKSQLEDKERKISILEWDKQRNQLQYSKEAYLKKLKEEAETLKERIRSME
ncbi:hypothetical protein D6764_02630 [Candidatus Woesearchaeota archaeon]|nr:MAG: hypothetical protein D6764_02630 [Candidatus Woesearchaeota archaeon]